MFGCAGGQSSVLLLLLLPPPPLSAARCSFIQACGPCDSVTSSTFPVRQQLLGARLARSLSNKQLVGNNNATLLMSFAEVHQVRWIFT